ncbi:unnamed protein product [Cylicocyclus nassatus]|uniref:F-box domain-containing protein n=1 Tax=Cylicocyclus nassatus TaxID=53992 RepID=A0AA36MAL2_CYLNA|nr:unnamed protein product [Cylicocyclus nassatus]
MEEVENEECHKLHDCRCHPWNKLPMEIKLEILNFLSLPTLRKFMFLSKECLNLVTNMRVDSMSMHLDDNTFIGDRKNTVTVRISRKIKTPYLSCFVTHYDLQFQDLDSGGCFVAREVIEDKRKVLKVGITYPEETKYTAALRVFAQFTKWIKAESLCVTMSPTDAEVNRMRDMIPETQKFSCSIFGIETQNPLLVSLFMEHLQPGCSLLMNEYTQLDGNECLLNREFFDTDVAKCSPSLNINALTEITDDQLLNLQADVIFIASSHITSRAVNQIIREWFEGKRKISQMFFDAMKQPSEGVLTDIDPANFRTAEELLEIVSEVSQWRVRELSPPWVGIQSKNGSVLIVKLGRKSCSLLSLDLE